jgi:adenosylcobyric acid synthase
LVINKFRGDVSLLYSGVEMIEERTGVPVLGIIQHVPNLRIADEDSVSLDHRHDPRGSRTEVDIAVVRFPCISNFDDFLALEYEEGVSVRYVDTAKDLRDADLVILPGTKDTRSDLCWLREVGMDLVIIERAEAGQPVLGVCGGYQMLGEAIEDELGVEGPAGVEKGLGLLPIKTRYRQEKTTLRVSAQVHPSSAGFLTKEVAAATEVDGYEIHMGDVLATEEGPWIFEHEGQRLEGKSKGSVCGTLLHGMFENEALRHSLLNGLGWEGANAPDRPRIATAREEFDRLADVLEESLDMTRLYALLEGSRLDGPEPSGTTED